MPAQMSRHSGARCFCWKPISVHGNISSISMASGDTEDETSALIRVAKQVGDKRNADILFYSGDIGRPEDDSVIDLVLKRRRRPNVLLVLCTYGGDPHAAYRIARCLQTHYKRF